MVYLINKKKKKKYGRLIVFRGGFVFPSADDDSFAEFHHPALNWVDMTQQHAGKRLKAAILWQQFWGQIQGLAFHEFRLRFVQRSPNRNQVLK